VILAADGNGCGPLDAALGRTDGASPPPDFAAGEAAPELAQRLRDLQEGVGCLAPQACGMGFEIVLLLAPLLMLRAWRRRGSQGRA